jgi:CDP-diacylglycerol--glycerol-3-phosphate 3-phosphatidyltransferase
MTTKIATTFGPGALATPANAVTIGRLVITPIALALMASRNADLAWPVVALWILLSCTDGLDGYLARKMGTTRSGAFLDPLADKILVLGAMGVLVGRGRFWWLPVVVIAAREVAISLYRSSMGRRGISVPARPLAKAKTVVQDIAVGFALLPWTADKHPVVASTWLWIAVALTVGSGLQYALDGERARPSAV